MTASPSTLVLFVCLGFLAVTALLIARAVRRCSYAAAGVTVLAALLLVGSVFLIVISNGSDDWIGL